MLNTSLFVSLVSSDLLLYSCIKCFTKDYLTVLNKSFISPFLFILENVKELESKKCGKRT